MEGGMAKLRIDSRRLQDLPQKSHCRRSDEAVSVAGKRQHGCPVRWCGESRGES